MMNFDELQALLHNRRSVRYYSDTPIEKALIEQILSAAILAPNVENIQPWRFHVITNPDFKTKMMETSCYGNFVAGSATFVVVVCDKTAQKPAQAPIWNPRELEYSCVAAMQTAMFAAETLGIGSCWVSLHHGPAHNLLKLKDHQSIVGGLMFGYPKEGEEKASGKHDRLPLSSVVTFHD